eukprot:gene30991-40321_t
MVLVEKSSTCMTLSSGKFLGSKDRVAIAGNCPYASVEVIYIEQETPTFDNNSEGDNVFTKTSGLYLDKGACIDFELCGIPRLARVFGAIAKTNPITLGGSISLVDIHTSYDTSSLESKADEEYSQFDSFCPYTSLTFNSNQEVLVAGCEDGAVVSWDMNTNQEIHRFYGDACGVNKVKFMQTDQLITLGSATGRHARQQEVSYHTGLVLGSIIIWDLRSGVSEEYHTHSSPVTDCMVHPSQHDTIVSSSLGGQVKAFNASSSLSIDCLDTIGAVTSLDYDLDSSMMLAVTSVGGLVRMKL